jgi:hypothetical protein
MCKKKKLTENYTVLYLEVFSQAGGPSLVSEGDEGDVGFSLCFALDSDEAAALLGATGVTTCFLPGWSNHFVWGNGLTIRRFNELTLIKKLWKYRLFFMS